MRNVLTGAVLFAATAGVSQASTLSAYLTATPVSAGSSTYNISVYAHSDQNETAAGNGDGGIAGFQFDILSDGTNLITPAQQAATGPNAKKVKTTFASSVSSNFSTVLPDRIDATPALNPAYVSDGDLDAPNGSFFDASAFSNTTLGTSRSTTAGPVGSGVGAQPGYDLIATEQWTLTNPSQGDHLSLFVVGGTYYDFTNSGNNFHSNFTTATATGVTVPAAVVATSSISLTSGTAANTVTGTITVTGGNPPGSYVGGITSVSNGSTGSVQINGLGGEAGQINSLFEFTSAATPADIALFVAEAQATTGVVGVIPGVIPGWASGFANDPAADVVEVDFAKAAGTAGTPFFINYNSLSSIGTGSLVLDKVAAVPEPTVIGLLGLVGMAGLSRRRRA